MSASLDMTAGSLAGMGPNDGRRLIDLNAIGNNIANQPQKANVLNATLPRPKTSTGNNQI